MKIGAGSYELKQTNRMQLEFVSEGRVTGEYIYGFGRVDNLSVDYLFIDYTVFPSPSVHRLFVRNYL